MKKEIKTNINEIKKISSKFPKSLNEALNFNEENDFVDEPIDDVPMDNDVELPEEKPMENEPSQKAKELIDNIRKMALKAMAELADTPDDENYLILKKVWAMTDRKPENENGMKKL